jgi:hypothetical protein
VALKKRPALNPPKRLEARAQALRSLMDRYLEDSAVLGRGRDADFGPGFDRLVGALA